MTGSHEWLPRHELETEVKRKVLFERETHFDGASASEILWQIGPFEREDVARVAA